MSELYEKDAVEMSEMLQRGETTSLPVHAAARLRSKVDPHCPPGASA